MNDVITLSSFLSSEKIAISFAMAQSCKLDVFEERVEDSTKETRHIPQTLADTGEIKKYSQKDISQLIGRLFIERSDINLNSDMLDDPDFFWDDDEYQPLYKNMIKYLDVANRVHILNTRLDVLREFEQLERQHATKLEWIVIWLIVAEVVVKVFWSILVKDVLGFFDHHGGIDSADGPSADELSPLMSSSQQRSPTLDYNSDSGVYYGRPRPGTNYDVHEDLHIHCLQSLDVPQLLRVAAYCSCESSSLFKLLRWLKRIQTGQLPGGELNPNGWTHKMHMGVIHSSCVSDDREEYVPSSPLTRTGCTVFWGLTQTEEQAHVHAISAFSNGILKHVDVEEMEFCYGDNSSSSVANDVVTLSSFRSSEKIAISFAMAQSCKLDVFEERVEETIQETRHIPQTLADTGEINMYSQKDISKLIGRLFIERSDINLNSDMLDDPDFFWDDDEYQPLYKHMMKYLDVDKRVHILNTRLDVLRELLDVLGEQLARQHDTNLEWIVIWVIVAAVFVKIFWNILVKDFMGLFCHN
ncbi:hypothetical protein DYB30_008528 [Aphanomyces astaci]|uniref:DUF155 domain-containing protein n=1 Tax=Aphanomyces astaci TaxID=112090 RepID=A0A397E167_APHAT|nr:hypothetical protein DYB34_006479 [Aphanomyces astaci]RHY71814.1 hypothetical protein DYB30_008528 [Aphanomyces astaci]